MFCRGELEPSTSISLSLSFQIYEMSICAGWPQMPLSDQTQFAKKTLTVLGYLTLPLRSAGQIL